MKEYSTYVSALPYIYYNKDNTMWSNHWQNGLEESETWVLVAKARAHPEGRN
jgi:hypothetical protein